jgi:predicted RNase H-like HicB family nuclease
VPPTAVLISSAEGSFVVYDPETGTATQGDSVPEAISNLREATESYLEDFPLEQPSQALLTNLEVAAHA